VLIEGELRSRLKENDDGTKRSLVEIKASHVQFLDKRTNLDSLDEESTFFGLGESAYGGNENLTALEGSW
jgi:single-stranded DNA-binding protein